MRFISYNSQRDTVLVMNNIAKSDIMLKSWTVLPLCLWFQIPYQIHFSSELQAYLFTRLPFLSSITSSAMQSISDTNMCCKKNNFILWELGKHIAKINSFLWVKSCSRLIKNKYFWVIKQGLCKQQPLFHSAWKNCPLLHFAHHTD